jgi:hypothetical protein
VCEQSVSFFRIIKQERMKIILLVLAVLIVTNTALNIECDLKMSLWWVRFGELYTCDVKSIALSGSKSLETVTGSHQPGKGNVDVQQIIFGHVATCNCMDFNPHNIHKRFQFHLTTAKLKIFYIYFLYIFLQHKKKMNKRESKIFLLKKLTFFFKFHNISTTK